MSETFEREKALQAKLEFLEASVSQARILIADVKPDGTIIEINPACEAVVGYSSKEVEGRPLWDLLHLEREVTETKAHFGSFVPDTFPRGFVRHLVTKDGSERTIAWSVSFGKAADGTVQCVRLLGKDLTEQQWIDRRFSEEDLPSRLILEQLPVIIWTVDRDLNLTLSVGKGLKAFGMRAGQSLGSSLWEVMHTSDPSDITISQHLRAMKGETVRFEGERFGHFFQNMIEPLRDASGAIKGVLGISVDITEQKNVENAYRDLAIKEKKTRLEVERLSRVKDEFLITLSHELRTPLVPILGWLELLKSSPQGSEDVALAIEAIERNAKSELHLIEDLLDVSRIIAGKLPLKREKVDLRKIATESIENFRLAADAKKIQLALASEDSPCVLFGDPNRLRQVFWNILSNAVKFTPKGGNVEMRLKRVGSFVEVTIRDTGIGIKPESLPHVFERFWQGDSSTSRRFGGLGLGLALARHLVEAHGGKIDVESPGENKGATFTIQFPIPAMAPKDDSPEGERDLHVSERFPTTPLPPLDGLRVLVVDDIADDRAVIKRIIEQQNAEVKTAASAKAALRVLSKWRPHVIVSDIGMAKKDGYAFMREVRASASEESRRIPAIALTAYADIEGSQRSFDVGFQKHLAKPVDSATLIMAIVEVMNRHAFNGTSASIHA